ncbi:MAG: FixH family protein [Polyangiaceae bacterium]|nr:FixH family protein [Polyangiaceae bacterium]
MQLDPRRQRHVPAALLAFAAAACGAPPEPDARDLSGLLSQAGALRGSFTPAPDPPATGDNSLAMQLALVDGAPLVGAALALEPWMPAHGHGTPTVPVVVELGAGSYRADRIHLTMPGHWEIGIRVEWGDTADVFILDYDAR